MLGRTNRAFAPVWLRLSLPADQADLDAMIEAADSADVPLDITTQPALWGGRLRSEDAFFTYVGSTDYAKAPSRTEAADAMEADVIQVLSAIGRPCLDVYFLRVRGPVEEFRVEGAFEALESARQEGHIRFVGLCCDGDAPAALALWRNHDAFELVMATSGLNDHRDFDALVTHARRQRVGVLTAKSLDGLGEGPLQESVLNRLRRSDAEHPSLIPVRSARDIEIGLSLDPMRKVQAPKPGEGPPA